MKSMALAWRPLFLALIAFILGCGESSENGVVGPDESVTAVPLDCGVTCPARLPGGLSWYNDNFTPGTSIPYG